MIEIDQNDVIAAINEAYDRIAVLEGDINHTNRKLDECQSVAQCAYECANIVGHTYEPNIDRIADLVTELVAERVMDRVWKMIDDAKNAPSEREFLTGIERLLSE